MNNITRKKTSRALALSIATLALSGAVLAASNPRGIPAANSSAAPFADKRPITTEASIDFGAYDPSATSATTPMPKSNISFCLGKTSICRH